MTDESDDDSCSYSFTSEEQDSEALQSESDSDGCENALCGALPAPCIPEEGRTAQAVQVTFSTASDTPAVQALLESLRGLLCNKDAPELPQVLRTAIRAAPDGQVLGCDDVCLAICSILESAGTPLRRKEELVSVLLGCDSLAYLHLLCSRPGADVVSAIFQCQESLAESEVLGEAVGLLYSWACRVGPTRLSRRQ